MPRVNGIVESALFVRDVATSRDFYERVLGFRKLVDDEEGLLFEVAARQLLLIVSETRARRASETAGGAIPACVVDDGASLGAGHCAFGVDREEIDSWRRHLASHGVEVVSEVDWDLGGRSLYFRDPDGHLLEFATPGVWEVY